MEPHDLGPEAMDLVIARLIGSQSGTWRVRTWGLVFKQFSMVFQLQVGNYFHFNPAGGWLRAWKLQPNDGRIQECCFVLLQAQEGHHIP